MEDKSRVFGKPRLHVRMVVGGIVIENEMQIKSFGRMAVDGT